MKVTYCGKNQKKNKFKNLERGDVFRRLHGKDPIIKVRKKNEDWGVKDCGVYLISGAYTSVSLEEEVIPLEAELFIKE